MWISRSGSMTCAISALFIAPDSLRRDVDRDDRVGAVGEDLVVDRLELAGARRRGLGERRVRRGHPLPELGGREVDAGPERLGAERDRQRDDPDAGGLGDGRDRGPTPNRSRRRRWPRLPPPAPCVRRDDTGRVDRARTAAAATGEAATLSRDGSIAVGRDGRHLHAPLLDRPHGGDAGRLPGEAARSTAARWSRRRPSASSTRRSTSRELVLSPVFGVLSDRLGHHRMMLVGPVVRGGRGHPHGADDEPRRPRRDAAPRGRVDRRERPVDPRLHRPRDRRQARSSGARRRRGSRARRSPGSASGSRWRRSCSRRSARSRSS